jgi:IPT/TIG domain
MRPHNWKQILILTFALLFCICGRVEAQAPTITSMSPTSGPVGGPVTITGTNFETPQGISTVSLNGTNAVATSWSNTSITAVVPSGALREHSL